MTTKRKIPDHHRTKDGKTYPWRWEAPPASYLEPKTPLPHKRFRIIPK